MLLHTRIRLFLSVLWTLFARAHGSTVVAQLYEKLEFPHGFLDKVIPVWSNYTCIWTTSHHSLCAAIALAAGKSLGNKVISRCVIALNHIPFNCIWHGLYQFTTRLGLKWHWNCNLKKLQVGQQILPDGPKIVVFTGMQFDPPSKTFHVKSISLALVLKSVRLGRSETSPKKLRSIGLLSGKLGGQKLGLMASSISAGNHFHFLPELWQEPRFPPAAYLHFP